LSLLIDASTWVSLADQEERYFEDARKLLVEAEVSLAALDLTFFEIANAVGVKKRQPERARWLTDLVAARCGARVVRVNPALVEASVQLAGEYDLTAYDAAYVVVARLSSWRLVSADHPDLVSKGLAVAPDAALYP
jgi:predicted nucleic acid-binding protein